jgi:serine/threonine-protein kinase RsbW
MGESAWPRRPAAVPEGSVALLAIDFDGDSLGALRGALTSCAAESGVADLSLSNFVLAANEIATNAVRHGGGSGRLRLWRGGGYLWCEIADTGQGIPRGRVDGHRRPSPGHIGGWGLWLARHLCESVDLRTGTAGTRVTLQYSLSH